MLVDIAHFRRIDRGPSGGGILLHMVKIAQTLSARRWMMDLAAGRRNEEETDLRVRNCDSTGAVSGANRTS
jgi:hypothetical protein